MGKFRRSSAPPPPRKPADAAAGAPLLRKFMLKLFDREDGKAADWPLIAETLLEEAFHALDQVPGDARVLTLLHRVNGGSYDRLTGNLVEASQPLRDAESGASPSPSADFQP
jgi:DNA-directed RNA polymerase specialized sigma24 family protein